MIGKIILTILAIIILLLVILTLHTKWKNKQPFIKEGYYEVYETSFSIEKEYQGMGSYEVSSKKYPVEDKAIVNYSVWYPTELEKSSKTYPLVVIANASGVPAFRYEPFFEHLASWGFIVIGDQNHMTNSGASCAKGLDLMLGFQNDKTNLFYQKIDIKHIGIAGFSQGGVGAIKAVTAQDNGYHYKTIFTGSAPHADLAETLKWTYDISKIHIPYFMNAGTLKNDTGEDGGIGVCPLFSLENNYNAITANVLKVRSRAANADHEDMLIRSDPYMTAWLRYHLMNDEKAGKAFVGENPELLTNTNWQDVEISVPEVSDNPVSE